MRACTGALIALFAAGVDEEAVLLHGVRPALLEGKILLELRLQVIELHPRHGVVHARLTCIFFP